MIGLLIETGRFEDISSLLYFWIIFERFLEQDI